MTTFYSRRVSRWLLRLTIGLGACAGLLLTGRAQHSGSRSLVEVLWEPAQLRSTSQEKLTIRAWKGGVQTLLSMPAIREEGPPVSLAPGHPVARVRLRQEQKLVALTFDVCEGAGERTGYDGDIVDYLRDNGIPATFFLGGKWMQNHPERAMQLMADSRFEIGTHGWAHLDSRQISGTGLSNELFGPLQQYELLRNALLRRFQERKLKVDEVWRIPAVPRLFRFPYGACSEEAAARLADWGIQAIQWDVAPGDPVPSFSAEVIARAVETQAHPGSIIVCHANGKGLHTAAAVALFIPALKQKGFLFVTVGQLLASGDAVDSRGCSDSPR